MKYKIYKGYKGYLVKQSRFGISWKPALYINGSPAYTDDLNEAKKDLEILKKCGFLKRKDL